MAKFIVNIFFRLNLLETYHKFVWCVSYSFKLNGFGCNLVHTRSDPSKVSVRHYYKMKYISLNYIKKHITYLEKYEILLKHLTRQRSLLFASNRYIMYLLADGCNCRCILP